MVTIPVIRGTRTSGFTLLELLVVLAIAGLLTSLVPSFIAAVVPGAKLQADARELAVFLRTARNDAVNSGQAVDVVFEPALGSYARHGEPAQQVPEDVVLAIKLNQEQFFARGPDVTRQERVAVRFYPDGTSAGSEVLLRRGNSAYVVEVDWLLGRVTVHPGNSEDER